VSTGSRRGRLRRYAKRWLFVASAAFAVAYRVEPDLVRGGAFVLVFAGMEVWARIESRGLERLTLRERARLRARRRRPLSAWRALVVWILLGALGVVFFLGWPSARARLAGWLFFALAALSLVDWLRVAYVQRRLLA
jgi:hypothetical protein